MLTGLESRSPIYEKSGSSKSGQKACTGRGCPRGPFGRQRSYNPLLSQKTPDQDVILVRIGAMGGKNVISVGAKLFTSDLI